MKSYVIYVSTVTILLVAIMLSLAIGDVSVSISHIPYLLIYPSNTVESSAIWDVRIPHIVMAFVIGACLSLAGLVMQTVMQNQLADPYLLGISSGANLGALLAIVSGLAVVGSVISVGCAAFVGTIIVSLCIMAFARLLKRMDAMTLLLLGFGINAFVSGIVSLVITLVADTNKTKSIQFWLLGNLQPLSNSMMLIIAIVLVISSAFFFFQSRILDLMLMGQNLSLTMGRSLVNFQRLYIIVVSIVVGITVYASGIIGFVGLVVPQCARILVGEKHSKLIPLSIVLGGTFLVWADVIGRNLIPGMSLPIGVAAAACGAPIFCWMVFHQTGGRR